jgi:hypothetical protein
MSYNCEKCNKNFKSRSGLWKHTNNHKNDDEETENNQEEKIFNCCYCNKKLASRQGKWRHEKKCKATNNLSLEEQVKKLSDEIQKIKEKPVGNISNNNNNNNQTNTTNNIQLIINPRGSEDINKLSFEECRQILDKKLNCITHMAEKLNFNKDIPENHSYCVTAINDKHASIINPETNTITKTDKESLFDELLVSYLDKLETIAKNSKFKNSERNEYINIINQLKQLLFQNKKYIKRYYTDLNYISYNNKDLIKNTWNQLPEKKLFDKLEMKEERLGFDDLSDDSSTEDSEDEIIKRKQQELKAKCLSKLKPLLNSFHESSESDNDSEDCVINEITIKNKTYILEGTNVYVKSKSGLKGELYGIYSKGKVKKIIKNKDIEV